MNNPCVIPTPPEDFIGDKRWMSMHERFAHQAKNSEAEVVFIGDSIIEHLQFSTIWTEKINALHCLNFGIGGDRVEHILWRIQNGEFDFNDTMKVVVLFVGTNNWDCTPHEIFEGIVNLVRNIREKLGDVPIIIPTLLPRGQYPNACRERNAEVNVYLLDKFENPDVMDGTNKNVHIVRIDEHVIQNDQTISHHVLYDYLHLTDAAYTKIWGPVYDKLCTFLKK